MSGELKCSLLNSWSMVNKIHESWLFMKISNSEIVAGSLYTVFRLEHSRRRGGAFSLKETAFFLLLNY